MTLFVGSALAVVLCMFAYLRLSRDVLPWSSDATRRAAIAIRARELYERGGGDDVANWLQAEREILRDAWLRFALGVALLIAGAFVASVVVFALLTLGGELFGYHAVVLSRDLTRPEAVQIVVGVVFAILLLQWWPVNWRPQLTEWRSYVILAVLPVFVLLVPHLDRLMESLSKLKAGGVELEFGQVRAQSRPTLELERDKMLSNTIERLSAPARVIPRDLHLANVRRHLATQSASKTDLPEIDAYVTRARAARTFSDVVLQPLFDCARFAKDRYPEQHTVEEILIPVALEFRALLGPPAGGNRTADAPDPGKNFIDRVTSAHKDLVARFGPDCARGPDPEEDSKPGPLATVWPTDVQIPDLAKNPHTHVLLANLLWFTGAVDTARDHLAAVSTDVAGDLNINYLLAQILYVSDRPFQDIGRQLTIVLTQIGQDRELVERVPAKAADVTEEALTALRTRYKYAQRIVTNDFAYWAAQAGANELTATEYAEENYRKREEVRKLPDVYCSIIDTHGYVKLVFGGRRRDVSAQRMVEDAQRLFEEAQTCVQQMSQKTRAERRDRQAMLRTFSLHARQAASLARDFR